MLEVLRQFMKMNLKKTSEYRLDFFIGVFAIFLTNAVSVVLFWVIFQNIDTINGWGFNDMIFLLGIYYLAFGIWHVFLHGASPHRIERYIVNGEFDMLLLRPYNTLKLLLMGSLDDDGLGDLAAGLLIFGYAANAVMFEWTLLSTAFILMTVAGAVLVIFSMMLIFTSVGFWIVKSSFLSDLFWPIMRLVEFPLDIYNPAIRFVLTFVLPLGFMNYYPVQFFLGKTDAFYMPVLSFAIGLLMLAVSYRFWRIGIRNYTSTGS